MLNGERKNTLEKEVSGPPSISEADLATFRKLARGIEGWYLEAWDRRVCQAVLAVVEWSLAQQGTTSEERTDVHAEGTEAIG